MQQRKPKVRILLCYAVILCFTFTLFAHLDFHTHASGDFIGDVQDGFVTGAGAGHNWPDTAYGAWRIYIADKNGGVQEGPVDVSNRTRPTAWAVQQPYAGMLTKLDGRNNSSVSSVNYEPIDKLTALPSLGAATATLKDFWERDNHHNFRLLCSDINSKIASENWNADTIIENLQSGEWAIAMEPVAWFLYYNEWQALSATECGIDNAAGGGALRAAMGNLTHRTLPGYAWLTDKVLEWDIPYGNLGFSGYLPDDATLIRTYGIAAVVDSEGCCTHAPNCPCTLLNPGDPLKCKCLDVDGHLHPSNPGGPVPCAPGVPGCDCFPNQCCDHDEDCACQPGEHPDNDPNCLCPDTHPGTPCGPGVPGCDCAEDALPPSTLVIKDRELIQALSAPMQGKGAAGRIQVNSITPFQPASGAVIGGSCQHGYSSYYCSNHDDYHSSHDDTGSHWYGNWTAITQYSGITAKLQPKTYMNRSAMDGGGISGADGQWKILGLLSNGTLDIKYATSKLASTYSHGTSSYYSGPVPAGDGPLYSDNVLFFLGHRQGAGRPAIPIAAYMKKTADNTAYKQFMNQRVTPTIEYPNMEGYKGLTDSGAGNFTVNVKYAASHSSGVRGSQGNDLIWGSQNYHTPWNGNTGTGGPCCGSHSMSAGAASSQYSLYQSQAANYYGNNLASVTLPQANYTWTVQVDGTVVETAKQNAPLSKQETYEIAPARDDIYMLQSPTQDWKFHPTFKMTADYTPARATEDKDVWVLAAGERTFRAYNALRIQMQSVNQAMQAPWSRDFEDRDQAFNITKAGTAYRTETQGNRVLVDAYVTIVDPNFVDPSERPAIIARNNSLITEYRNAVQTAISGGAPAWSFFTNARGGSSANSLYQVPIGTLNADEIVKTRLKPLPSWQNANASSITFNAYRSNGKVAGFQYVDIDSYSSCGFTYTNATSTIPASIDEYTKAQTRIGELLTTQRGWYNEDYEGIIVVHISGTASISRTTSDYSSLYRHESDWQTPLNANALALKHIRSGHTKIAANSYGVGTDYRIPAIAVEGTSINDLNVGSRVYTFGVRGNVFDDT